MEKRNSTSDYREIKLHRRLLAVLGGVYFLWWFLVEALLPGNYNPFLSRLLVVSIPSLFLLLSFFNIWIKTRLRILLDISLYLVTFHYFYLFYVNVGNGEINWIIGAFITITAISYCFFSSRAVLIYSLYVLLLSVATAVALPDLRHSVFFPGLATILFQANIGWRSRLNLINTLSESNKKFQTLFDSTFEGILVHENGVIISANEALAKMTGYSKEELLGRNTVSLTTPEQIANAKERLKKKTDQPYDSQVVRKDGSVLDVEARSREFNYNSQPAYLVTVKDITDRKQAEQERVAALAMAENLRLRDDFISSASHEFKTPIAILRLQAQII
ncbi:MAG: PAS domain S-box protein, partial [Pseudobdellovibrio sp.]